ncbi:MAG: ATP-dependent RNA helicase HrpA [Deltaproteobacteria bacterium]|nr:ATP-dependent RNA helicase HrpA [Deltaproteobacteria bacterium]
MTAPDDSPPRAPAGRRRRRRRLRPDADPGNAPRPAPTPASLPDLAYPPELPIVARRDEIVAAIRDNPVVVITGATGSGKSTQLPKMCLEAGRGRGRLVACTQPRRIAAVTVAARVAEELGPAGEGLVGYKIRFADRTRPSTRIKFVTDGMLLAETQGDPELRAYDTIIVDEAHERSLNIDFLFGILTRLLARRTDLKVVITSATIDTDKFSQAFNGAPVIEVSGRTYPVEVQYRPLDPEAEESGDITYVDQAVEAVAELHRSGRRDDVLVFLPTERDIVEALAALEGRRLDHCVVLPLYGRLSGQEQGRIFQRADRQKVVLATNVAETSVTVPGIRTVVDSGLARLSTYNPRARTQSLPIRPISRSSADQRAGRCGRVGPGLCIRLYAEEDYGARPQFTLPEIQRSNLAEVILRMAALGLGDPAEFPFLDPPSSRALKDGTTTLIELGALDGKRQLTAEGRLMARLPLDPRVSRMLLEARKTRALREVAIIAAGLSVQDPRERPADQRDKADLAHARFKVPGSDFLGYVAIWDAYHDTLEELKTQGRMRRFCRDHFLSFQRMREWRDVHEQIGAVLRREPGFAPNGTPAAPEAVHRAILSGHLRNIGVKKEKNVYLGAGNQTLTIFPGSGQVNRAGPWIVAGELVETSRLFARTVATIDPGWLEELAGPLCRRSYVEPHWEKNRGQVVASETVTLFGLVIVAGRRVDYGRVNPREAREIFLRSALVEGELKGFFGFLEHNKRLLAKLEDLEDKIRRRGLLPDDETLFAFYDGRVGEVCDQRTLAKQIKERGSDDFLRLQEEDLLSEIPPLEPFPSTLRVGDLALPLSYRFEPGHEADGVTVTIPGQRAADFDPAVFEWVVPGLLEEKVHALLKGLPKSLRRHLVPVAKTAGELLEELQPGEGSLLGALQDLLLRRFRLRVSRSDWPLASLPVHLCFRFQLAGDGGEPRAATRDYSELLAAAAPAPASGASDLFEEARRQWERDDVIAYDGPDLPDRLSLGAGVHAFPGFARLENGRAAVRLFSSAAERARTGRAGLLALYGAYFGGELAVLKKDLAPGRDEWPLFEGLGGSAAAARDALDLVLTEVFETRSGAIPDRAAFLGRVSALKGGGLFRRAQEVHGLLLTVLEERRRALDLLARYRPLGGPSAARFDVIRAALDRLVPADVLQTASTTRLAELPRLLKALRVRIERAHVAPAKDADKERQVLPHEARLAAALGCVPFTPEQALLADEYGRMIEELRVSLFAQELGTAFPVSAQRLDRKWEELRGSIGVMPDGR